jgi:hypothetical protein
MRNFTNLSERSHFVTAPDLGIFTGSIATSNSFSTSLNVTPGVAQFAIKGTWAGTATLQLSPDNTNWYDIQDYTTNVVDTVSLGMKCYLRVGFKASAYTSGTADWLLGQGY